jgi:hypothetical protein
MFLRLPSRRRIDVRAAAFVACMLALASCFFPVFASLAQGAAPQAAARQWLSYVDGADYAKGWGRAGEPFKARNSPALLQARLAPVREPLGAVLERRLASVTLTDSAPGLPSGKYASVQFHSRFAGKSEIVETVWLDLEKDRWAVIGYFLGDGGDISAGGTNCSHDEQVQARIARMNGYTQGPKCNLPE